MSKLKAEDILIYYEKTFQTAFFIAKNKEIAEDATQEAFLKAYNKIKGLHDPNKIGPWLAVIAMNCARDLLKKRKLFQQFDDIETIIPTKTNDSNEFSKLDLKVDTQRILSIMTIEHKQVLVLRYYYDLPVKDIAKYLGISVAAVRSRLHRAKAKVKKIVQVDNVD